MGKQSMCFFFLVGIFISLSSIFAHFMLLFKMFSINKCKLGFDV